MELKPDRHQHAAMTYCKLKGWDPHERICHGHQSGYAVALYTPRYLVLADEFKDMELRMLALQAAQEIEANPPVEGL